MLLKLIDRLENRRRLASIEAAKEKAKAEGKKHRLDRHPVRVQRRRKKMDRAMIISM